MLQVVSETKGDRGKSHHEESGNMEMPGSKYITSFMKIAFLKIKLLRQQTC